MCPTQGTLAHIADELIKRRAGRQERAAITESDTMALGKYRNGPSIQADERGQTVKELTTKYILRDIVLELYDGENVRADLDAVSQLLDGIRDADMLDAFLNEISDSQDALGVILKRNDEHPSPFFNVKAIDCFLNRGYNVSRIRPLRGRLSHYRILVALDAGDDAFHLLAIVRKRNPNSPPGNQSGIDYNYESSHLITRRVCDEYDKLGIPRLNA